MQVLFTEDMFVYITQQDSICFRSLRKTLKKKKRMENKLGRIES